MKWTTENIPNQNGRVAIVTGANSGIGFETAKALADAGAGVVLACRNLAKAEEAAARIRAEVPHAEQAIIRLDLADLATVRAFADTFRGRYERLDLLINNAGVMVPPYGKTADGFELQFGANHLGHFALTGLLLDLLSATPGARVVNVSSIAHRSGQIQFDDLQWEQGYRAQAAYGQSKLANLLFTLALNRRLQAAGADVVAAAAHPGWTYTNLQRGFVSTVSRIVGQSAAMGALPTLYAAVAPEISADDYIGPGGFMEVRGHPAPAGRSAAARDTAVAERLWTVSEQLTGVVYNLPAPAPAPA